MRFPDEIVEPIRPDDLAPAKAQSIPPEVIEAVNELIVDNFVDRRDTITITQPEIITRTLSKMAPDACFDRKWLNFEALFQSYGWNVCYSKPSYDETFDPFFVFQAK